MRKLLKVYCLTLTRSHQFSLDLTTNMTIWWNDNWWSWSAHRWSSQWGSRDRFWGALTPCTAQHCRYLILDGTQIPCTAQHCRYLVSDSCRYLVLHNNADTIYWTAHRYLALQIVLLDSTDALYCTTLTPCTALIPSADTLHWCFTQQGYFVLLSTGILQ